MQFNDRRNSKEQYPNTGKGNKGMGGTPMPRKPKTPKSPFPAMAMKHKTKAAGGY